jgi:branched-chain amino acid transport system permease protein
MRARAKVMWVAAMLVALAALAPFAGSFVLLLLTKVLVFGILAMSADILLGYTGLPTMGHAAYLAVGAYFAAILADRHGIGLGCDFFAVMVGGFVLGAALAAVFGLIAMRATGVYFLMITLALGMVVWGLAYRWNSLTGGDNGINLLGRPVCGVSFSSPLAYYYVALGGFTLILAGLYVLVNSPFGRSLVGIRESETRMRILGYHTWLHKYLAYIVAGACGGFAGVLWAFVNLIVSPQDAVLTTSVDALLMVILGGPGTLIGAALGSAVVVFLREYLSTQVSWWQYVLGIVYILTIYYLPDGLIGIPAALQRWRGSRGGTPPAAISGTPAADAAANSTA